jgi:GT2 family glycosyltransferase
MIGEKTSYSLTIIIVNWNTKDLLERCLHSVFSTQKNLSFKVIVVDNASSDGSVEMIKKRFPAVFLIENKQNMGFAKANNQAFKFTKNTKYVLLLNSDTVLLNKTLQVMMEFMDRNPKAGIAAPALRLPDGKFQIVGASYPSLITAFNYFLFLYRLSPKVFKGSFIDQRRLQKITNPIKIDWVAGTCMLVRKDVIDKAGGLDESYFMYAEDIEWCERIKKRGWEIYYFPHVEIIHHHGASSKTVSNLWLKSLISYMKQRNGMIRSILFRLIMAAGFGLRSFSYFLRFTFTHKQEWIKKAHLMYIFLKGALS